jgi:hypothetical protein
MCKHHEQMKDTTMMHNESLKELPMHRQHEWCKMLQWSIKRKFEGTGCAQTLRTMKNVWISTHFNQKNWRQGKKKTTPFLNKDSREKIITLLMELLIPTSWTTLSKWW